MTLRSSPASTTVASYHAMGSMAETLRSRILELIEEAGEDGLIGDDVRLVLAGGSVKDGSINTRFSELERAGLICRNGDTRPGASGRQQLVLRAAWYASATPMTPRKRTAFLSGLMYASKIVRDAEDMKDAKRKLKEALLKTALSR